MFVLCLVYFTCNVLKVHPPCCMCQNCIPFLNNIPLYLYPTFCSSVCLLMDIWVVFIFWLLWITLLWILVYRYLFESLLLILLGAYPGVELLDHVVVLCWIFEEPLYCFPQRLHHAAFPPAMPWGSGFSTSLPALVISVGFLEGGVVVIVVSMITILLGVKWYLTGALICIFLISNVEHPFMYLLDICTSSLEKSLVFAHF